MSLWMLRIMMLASLVGIAGVDRASAQFGGEEGEGRRGFFGRGRGPGGFLRRFDENENGILEVDELNEMPERMRDGMADTAREAGIDFSQPVPLDRLEEAMQRAFEQGRGRGGRGRGRGRGRDEGDGDGDRRGRDEDRDRRRDERERGEGRDGQGQNANAYQGRGFNVAMTQPPTRDLGAQRVPAPGTAAPAGPAPQEDTARFAAAAKRIMEDYDANKDKLLQKDEYSKYRFVSLGGADSNGDGNVVEQELATFLAARAAQVNGGQGGGGSTGNANASSTPPSGPTAAASTKVVASASGNSYRLRSAKDLLPEGLPPWFAQKDADSDGQVIMAEWTKDWSDEQVQGFLAVDLNKDGVITPKEALAKKE
jgi:hypothetical protein